MMKSTGIESSHGMRYVSIDEHRKGLLSRKYQMHSLYSLNT